MKIKYLIKLNNTPTIVNKESGFIETLEPLLLQEIDNLQNQYNNGNLFPIALGELLLLAGKYCYVLDYGIYGSQQEMQNEVRSWLNSKNRVITRPFFVIDIYGGGSQFLFIYLDENSENPQVYSANLSYSNILSRPWLYSLNKTLSEYIDNGILKLESGINPF